MTNALGAKPAVDTSEFKARLKEMNADLRVLESGFRASTASMGDWAATGTGLEARIQSLNSQMDVQRGKVSLLRSEYERIKAEKGEDANATKFAEVEYNKAAETLGKMESELRKTEGALKGVKAPTEEAGKEAERSAPRWDGLRNALGGVVAVAKATVMMLLGLVAGAAAAAVALGGLVFSAGNAASALMDMSEKTGISTTRLQELQYFGSQYKLTLDTIATSQARMTRSMATAAGGTGDAAKAWKTLGVEVTNADGSLRDQEDVFAETIDALGEIENAAERDAMAMAIFGRGAQELNPLINAGSGELKKFSREAHLMGAVVSKEGIEALDQFKDKFDATMLALKGMSASIAILILPDFSQFMSGVQGFLMQVAYLLKGSGGDITKILNGYFEVTPDGRVLFHQGIIEMLLGIVDLIAANAPKLAEGGLQILNGLLLGIIKNLPRLLTAGETMIAGIMQAIIDNLPQIVSSGTVILTALINAINENLPILLPMAVEIITVLVDGLAAAIPEMAEPIGLAAGLIIGAIIAALVANGPALGVAVDNLILGLAQGLANTNIGGIFSQEAQDAIESFFTELGLDIAIGAKLLGPKIVESLKKIGKAMVDGLWGGIKEKNDWLVKQFEDFINGVIEAAKKALGIQSPSKVMFQLGVMTSRGFGLGLMDELRSVQDQMGKSFGNLANLPAFASAGSGAPSIVNSNNGGNTSFAINGLQMPNMGPQTTIADIMEFLNKRG